MNPFAGKIAIVTGGASGLGRALCQELGRQRAVVIVADLDAESGEQVAASINAAGGQASFRRVDVSQAAQVRSLVDAAVQQYGRLDYLFNNAGYAVAGDVRDIDFEHWRGIIEVNLWGVIHGTAAAYPIMTRQRSGHIVNTASLAGLIGCPTLTPYVTTKFAVVGLSANLREEAAGHGVKVSVVCPGFIDTGIFDAATIVRASKREVLSLVQFKMMDAEEAARRTLRGVERNQARIVFPFYARLLWWLYRLSPELLAPAGRKMIRDFEKLRRHTEE